VEFLVDDATWPEAVKVSQASVDARRAVTRRDEAFAESNRSAPPPVAQYDAYIVRRGETLTGLARRFQTSPDVLRQLNQLKSDEIRSGQRLRVPRVDTLP
jgi:LysM repeat protein